VHVGKIGVRVREFGFQRDRLRKMLDDKKCVLIFASQEFRYDLTGFCVGYFNLRANPKSFERSPLVQ
jgi:hypothetical protein